MWPDTKPKKCILWGNCWTHGYIHIGYYLAMKYLDWDVELVDCYTDQGDKYKDCDEYLFITEGNLSLHIPIHPNAFYILHNCDMNRFVSIPEKNKLIQQVFTTDVFSRNIREIHPFEYWQEDANTFYMPWATDLTPNEIDENIQKIKEGSLPIQHTNRAFFLGTIWEGEYGNMNEINKFKEGCGRIGLPFETNTQLNVPKNEVIEQMQQSTITPTVCGTWQKKVGYIPCRIFKTVSYGHIGVTNSKHSYDILNGLVLYDEDESKLAELAMQKLYDLPFRINAMKYVRDHHTYVNRIESFQYIFKLKRDTILS